MTEEPERQPRTAETPPRRRRTRWVVVAVVVGLGLVLVAALAWVGARALWALVTTKPLLARSVGQPLPVVVEPVIEENITEVIGGVTLAESVTKVAVTTAVSQAKVRTVRAELGALVKADDVLVEFDTDVFREALERSQLQVELAVAELRRVEAERRSRAVDLANAVKTGQERVGYWTTAVEASGKTYDRTRALWEQQVVSLAEVEQVRVKWESARASLARSAEELARAEHELANEPVTGDADVAAAEFKLGMARQDLAQARRNMAETVIRAPIVGVVAERSVDVGEWVKSGKVMFGLDSVDPIYAVAEIPQEKAGYAAVGMEATVIFDAYGTEVLRGQAVKLDPSVDPVKRTFKLFVQLRNPGFRLRPGMAGFTRLERQRRVVLAPRVGVIRPTGTLGDDATVFVLEGDRVAVRKVKIGRADGVDRVEVLSGLRPGEWVLVHGQKDVDPGDRVSAERIERPTKTPRGGR